MHVPIRLFLILLLASVAIKASLAEQEANVDTSANSQNLRAPSDSGQNVSGNANSSCDVQV